MLCDLDLSFNMTLTSTCSYYVTDWQWRRNEINIAGARRGRDSKPGGLSQSPRVLAEGAYHQLGGFNCGGAVSFPSGVLGKAPAA